MNLNLESLNENQRKAATWNDGPLLVLASPGSGKTRVLTTRIARILGEFEDASILALTFTNKAAAEMRTRVEALLGQRVDRVSLSTFHSYATQILRQHGSHVGVNPDFALLTLEEDRLAQLDSVARAVRSQDNSVPDDNRNLLRLIDHLFREDYDGGLNAPGLPNTPSWLPQLFSQYCASLLAANRQDFGSLLHLACRLLRDKPAVARVIQIGWSHVCVDEFQDTNKAQYELLRLVAPPPEANLFVVGDDDQILYQWNGASPERLLALRADYKTDLIQLPENYRCPHEIIEIANNLIKHNVARTAGKLPLAAHRPPSGGDDTIRYREFADIDDEVEFVANDILARQNDAHNCVVLARTGKLLEAVAAAIQKVGLSPYLARTKNDFESAPARVTLLSLRLANARHDREILRRLCVAWNKLTGTTIDVESVVAASTLLGGDFLRAWADVASLSAGHDGEFLLINLRKALVDHLDFPHIVDWFLDNDWTDLLGKHEQLSEELQIWKGFHGDYMSETSPSNTTLYGYLQLFDLSSKVVPANTNSIRCLTVHGAKGLEFKHVYLLGLSQDILPSFQALKNGPQSRELEEERRNCFVAITRAQESLTMTRATQYNGWPKARSQFVAEMAGSDN